MLTEAQRSAIIGLAAEFLGVPVEELLSLPEKRRVSEAASPSSEEIFHRYSVGSKEENHGYLHDSLGSEPGVLSNTVAAEPAAQVPVPTASEVGGNGVYPDISDDLFLACLQPPYNNIHECDQSNALPLEPTLSSIPLSAQAGPPLDQYFDFNVGLELDGIGETYSAGLGMDQHSQIGINMHGLQDSHEASLGAVNIIPDVGGAIARSRRKRGANVSGNGRRRGRLGPLTEAQKIETRSTRRIGACIHCRMSKIQVKSPIPG